MSQRVQATVLGMQWALDRWNMTPSPAERLQAAIGTGKPRHWDAVELTAFGMGISTAYEAIEQAQELEAQGDAMRALALYLTRPSPKQSERRRRRRRERDRDRVTGRGEGEREARGDDGL